MTAYAVAHLRNVRVGDEIKRYVAAIDETLQAFDGRFLVHGGPKTLLEGQWPGDVIIVAFPTRTAAEGWYESDDYRAILKLRTDNSEGDVVIVDGVGPGHRATDVFE